jgi:hypothetical protein
MYIPSINFWMPESIVTKFGMYVTAPESISTAYYINPSHQSVCMYNTLSLLGNGSVITFLRHRRIVGGVVSYAVRTSCQRNFLFIKHAYPLHQSSIFTIKQPVFDRFFTSSEKASGKIGGLFFQYFLLIGSSWKAEIFGSFGGIFIMRTWDRSLGQLDNLCQSFYVLSRLYRPMSRHFHIKLSSDSSWRARHISPFTVRKLCSQFSL